MPDPLDQVQALRKTHRLVVEGAVNAVAWNFDGSRLAALSDFGSIISTWDTSTWTVLKKFQRYGGGYSQNSFAFLPDNTLLTSAPIGTSPDPRYATLAIFSLVEWNAETGRPIRYIPDQAVPHSVRASEIAPSNTFAVSADGAIIAGIVGTNVVIFETKSGTIVKRVVIPPTADHPDYALSIAIAPNGRDFAVGTGFGYVRLFSMDDQAGSQGLLVFPGGFGFRCSALAYSPEGQYLSVGRGGMSIGDADDGWTRILRLSDGAVVARLTGGRGSVRALSWNPKGDLLTVGDDQSLRLWRTDKFPLEPRPIWRASNKSYSVQFSPGGDLAASDGSAIVIYQ